METEIIRRGYTRGLRIFLRVFGYAFAVLSIFAMVEVVEGSPYLYLLPTVGFIGGVAAYMIAGRYAIVVTHESVSITEIFTKTIKMSDITELSFGSNFLTLYAGSRFNNLLISSGLQDRDDIIRLLISKISSRDSIKVRGNKKAIKKFWEDSEG